MPTEIARTTVRKQIIIGGIPVDIPVIQDITFFDPVKRGQESVWTFDNSPDSTRDATVHDVGRVKVERIVSTSVLDPISRGQETVQGFTNTDPPPATPETIGQPPQHWTVHYIRYYANDDTTLPWVDIEVIDEYHAKDPVDRGQETYFTLTGNPPEGIPENDSTDPYQPTRAVCDLTLPLVDYSTSKIIDPPYRLDPFQNIVNVPANLTIVINWSDWLMNSAFQSGLYQWVENSNLIITMSDPTNASGAAVDGAKLVSDKTTKTPTFFFHVGPGGTVVPPDFNNNGNGFLYQRIIEYKIPSIKPGETIKLFGTISGSDIRDLPHHPASADGVLFLAEAPTGGPYPTIVATFGDGSGAGGRCSCGPQFIITGPVNQQSPWPYAGRSDYTSLGPYSTERRFEVSLKNIAVSDADPSKIEVWFSKPSVLTIDNAWKGLVPTPYTMGLYQAFAFLSDGTDWIPSTTFLCGGEPKDSNKYTGTFP